MNEPNEIRELTGTITRGMGAATGALAAQLPVLAHFVPALHDILPGTVNVVLDCALMVLEPDVRTPPIKWHPEAPPEAFEFIRCRVKFSAANSCAVADGWIYRPLSSQHRADPRHVELIFNHKVLGATPGTATTITLVRPAKPLAWVAY